MTQVHAAWCIAPDRHHLLASRLLPALHVSNLIAGMAVREEVTTSYQHLKMHACSSGCRARVFRGSKREPNAAIGDEGC
jgi:hypothetical protein